MKQSHRDNNKQETRNKKPEKFQVSSFKFKVQSGQSLVEVVIALGVVVILAVSLVSTSLITQRTSRSAKNNTQATKLVQESIEQLRVLRDRKGFSYLAGFTSSSQCWKLVATNNDPMLWELKNTAPDTCPQIITLNQTDFSRRIIIENPLVPLDPTKAKKITVEVTWVDTGGTQKVSNVTNLSNCVSVSVIC